MTDPSPSDPGAPAVAPLEAAGLTPVLARNVAALAARRERERRDRPAPDAAADAITRFVGSLAFVGVHAMLVLLWVAANLGWLPGAPRFDRSFVILATAASVEAIFLSTFVLISQNRATADADRRADLDLQTNLLAEHEISRVAALVHAIARKLEVAEAEAPDLPEISRDVAPETVLDGLDAVRRE